MKKMISALAIPCLLLLSLAAAGCAQRGSHAMDKPGMDSMEDSQMDSSMGKEMEKMDDDRMEDSLKKGM